MRFVVQEHFATHHHFDFRLEMEGVARSWAVPKGLPERKGERRLAIQVEDHEVDYMGFEGGIPEGMYGAGKVVIWDEGEYKLLKMNKKEVKVDLDGKKLKGAYVLLRFPKGGENAWLVIKQS
ncbi:MAG: DNA polymerase ligase N-terminal domain-containing protein [Methanosarcinales archaeon Met12]|nr:MAG: DNA polymerase ligase N-terminal domain-containing protein [Methanosarcinales archaeon Met12]